MLPILSADTLPITTFGELPDNAPFQIIWTVPGPMPELPPQTIFTKIAPMQLAFGVANAIYRSGDPTMHNGTEIPPDRKVLRVPARYAIGVTRPK